MTWDVQIKFSASPLHISLSNKNGNAGDLNIYIMYFCNINKSGFLNATCFHSIQCMAPQPLQKTSSFFFVFCSSLPSSYSRNLWRVPPDDVLPSCSWFSHLSYIMKFPIKNFFGDPFIIHSYNMNNSICIFVTILNQVACFHEICYKWLSIGFQPAKHNLRIFKG